MQQLSLQNIGVRIQNSAQKIPGMNVLLNKINTRQKRNALILGRPFLSFGPDINKYSCCDVCVYAAALLQLDQL
jgi:hypothetical protein